MDIKNVKDTVGKVHVGDDAKTTDVGKVHVGKVHVGDDAKTTDPVGKVHVGKVHVGDKG